ncbi:RNA-directed DNA polymerase, eukaryota [Artemisia annua]|uniref:RNA-directed DNA polymerase, eukaryota n=1 Tax=Artemisia annua TaxID=35608 RepID=A0A2U1P6R8_ARTAN|nr:RNA-directed DNA polymerase, eukaryota [Artemisia annua]
MLEGKLMLLGDDGEPLKPLNTGPNDGARLTVAPGGNGADVPISLVSVLEALWKQVIQAIHGQFEGGASKKGTWANITKLDEELQQLNILFTSLFSRKIGKRDSVNFWADEWIGDLNLANMFPRLYALELEKDCSLSERLIRVGETFTWSWSWNWRRALRSKRKRADFD